MAKRQKLKNVVISNEELKPTVVGYLDSKQKGPVLLFFIFAILIAALYYMPEISNYVNKNILKQTTNKEVNPIVEDNITTEKIVEATEDVAVKVGDLEFRDFTFNGNNVTFTITNTGKSDINLSNYYYETYSESQSINERVNFSNETINSNQKLDISLYTIYNDYKYISFSQIDANNLPEVSLSNNTLTCSKTKEEQYTYNFNSGSLVRVVYTVVKEKTDYEETEYNSLLSSYTEMAAAPAIDGISNRFSHNDYSFTFTKTIDLIVTDANNIDNELYYKKQESAKKIAFDMSIKGYKCN